MIGAQNLVLGSNLQQVGHRVMQVRLPGCKIPVHPRDLIVSAVGVVVAILGAADLIAHRNHWRSRGQNEGAHEIAQGLLTPLANRARGLNLTLRSCP